ncbi:MAG: DUF983 domain-containing protein [Rhizobiaceae bacterium]
MNDDKAHYAPVDPVKAGISAKCPRCGTGRLFSGYLTTAKGCSNCGLDYTFIDSGDGPAVFVILIIGFVVTGLALYTEVKFNPPLWVHFIVWIPLVIILSLVLLRWMKGLLIALQYRNKAAEGRIDQKS